MSATAAVETLRERRLARNRRNAGAGLRAGWNDSFLSPAEEAAERVAQREADEALVAAELAREDDFEQRMRAAAEEAASALPAAKEDYLVSAGNVTHLVTQLLGALEEAVAARIAYERVWEQAAKADLADVRVAPLALGAELNKATVLAQRA